MQQIIEISSGRHLQGQRQTTAVQNWATSLAPAGIGNFVRPQQNETSFSWTCDDQDPPQFVGAQPDRSLCIASWMEPENFPNTTGEVCTE